MSCVACILVRLCDSVAMWPLHRPSELVCGHRQPLVLPTICRPAPGRAATPRDQLGLVINPSSAMVNGGRAGAPPPARHLLGIRRERTLGHRLRDRRLRQYLTSPHLVRVAGPPAVPRLMTSPRLRPLVRQ
jgi:hypothetical protein